MRQLETYLFAFFIFDWRTFSRRVQHGGDISQQKITCGSIITREMGGVSLSDVLYVRPV